MSKKKGLEDTLTQRQRIATKVEGDWYMWSFDTYTLYYKMKKRWCGVKELFAGFCNDTEMTADEVAWMIENYKLMLPYWTGKRIAGEIIELKRRVG